MIVKMGEKVLTVADKPKEGDSFERFPSYDEKVVEDGSVFCEEFVGIDYFGIPFTWSFRWEL